MVKSSLASLGAVLLLAPHAVGAQTIDPARLSLRSDERALAPLAFVKFCEREPNDCKIVTTGATGTADVGELEQVNDDVNSRIRPRRKHGKERIETWTVEPLSGDCNDYAITKRHKLLERGLPSSELLLSEVETSSGEAHLVLVVRAKAGDLVLDNLAKHIRPVELTPYKWIKQQSSTDPNVWIRADRLNGNPVAPSAGAEFASREQAAPEVAPPPDGETTGSLDPDTGWKPLDESAHAAADPTAPDEPSPQAQDQAELLN